MTQTFSDADPMRVIRLFKTLPSPTATMALRWSAARKGRRRRRRRRRERRRGKRRRGKRRRRRKQETLFIIVTGNSLKLTMDGEVAQGSCTVKLYIFVARVQQLHEDGYGSRLHKFISIRVCKF